MQPYTFDLMLGPGSTFTSTLTLADIGNLSINLVAGGKYLVKAWIQFATSSTTTTAGFSLGGTVGEIAPTAFMTTIRNSNTNDGANLSASAAIPAIPQTSNVLATASTYVAIIDGLVVAGPTGSGTLTVQAKHVATPAFTIAANAAAMLVEQIG